MYQSNPNGEPSWLRLLAGHVLLAVLVAIAATPVYLWVDPAERPLVARLAVALVLGISLRSITKIFRARLEHTGPSEFERALRPTRWREQLDSRFDRLRTDLELSSKSWHYFETVLYPQLQKLAHSRGGSKSAVSLDLPHRRSAHRRGPKIRTLEELIGSIERLP
jgi:hypothetical protein